MTARRFTTVLFAAALAAGTLVAGAVAPPPAAAANEGSVTFAAPGDVRSFNGTVSSRRVEYTCTGIDDAVCPTYTVTLAAPLTLTTALTSATPATDLDLYLYGPGSTDPLTSSATPSSSERFDASLVAGTYTVQIQPFITQAGTAYTLALSAQAPTTPVGSFTSPAEGGTHTFSGDAPTTDVGNGCQGNADDDCRLFEVVVPYTGAQITVEDAANAPSTGEYTTTILTGGHVTLGENTFINGDDKVTVNLPGAGTYLLLLSSTVARPGDSYDIDVTLEKKPEGGGTEVTADPGVQPADNAAFPKTVGFATKTGFRGVFSWQASEVVDTVVHYGTSKAAVEAGTASTVKAFPGAPDTAGIAVVDGLEVGEVYFWRVVDAPSGTSSVTKSFTAANAYTDWNGSSYTIDLLVQLDSQSLPPNIPADQAIEDIAQGLNVFAERVHDATDGFVRIGDVIVTDTNLDYATNVPFQPTFSCDAGNNLADVLVQTTVPFDSHTFGGFAIDDPCTSFYVGRVGQLVIPWEDDLHFGYVSTHELMHYAFSTPDLYPPDAGTTAAGGCKNLDWDGSVMHNTGGFSGARWELTELDRNPTLTPCDHSEGGTPQPYSWDMLRSRYLNVPLRETGPIEHIIDVKPRGNADGGAFSPYLLDREPAASTLGVATVSDEGGVECPANATTSAYSDPAGDVAILLTTAQTDQVPAIDILAGTTSYDDATDTLTSKIEVAGDPDAIDRSNGNRYRVSLSIGGRRISLYGTRALTEPLSTTTDVRRFEAYLGDATFPPASAIIISGSFDSATRTVTLSITGEQLAALYVQIPAADTAPRPALGSPAAVVGSIAVETGYDNHTGTAGGDEAGTACEFATDSSVDPVVPELPGGPALPLGVLALVGAVVLARRRRQTGTA